MKVHQNLVLYLFPLIILAGLANDALASCPTTRQGPPCQEFWRTEAVFIGVASKVVHTPNNTGFIIGPYLRTTVYFSIEEAFKGVDGTAIVFNLDHCGYVFKENERYLVYAHRNPNNQELVVRAGHTRTRPFSEAAEDLEYIRGLSSAEPGSRVFGKALYYAHDLKHTRNEAESLQNIEVTLEGNNQRQEVVTDSEGRYEFKGLPAGTYRLRAKMPAHLKFDEQTIKLNGRECVPFDLSVISKGQIAGRILDINDKPLDSVPVSLVPADSTLDQIEGKEKGAYILTFTNKEGRYGFTQLAPGRYLLIMNRTESDKSSGSQISRALPRLFYPGVSDLGGATVIVVSKEHEPREYDFRLPIQQ